LSDSDDIVYFSFGFAIELRFYLIEEHEVAIEHLQAGDKAVVSVFFNLYGVNRLNNYLMRFDIGSYLKIIKF
jgi:hypothetical protein